MLRRQGIYHKGNGLTPDLKQEIRCRVYYFNVKNTARPKAQNPSMGIFVIRGDTKFAKLYRFWKFS